MLLVVILFLRNYENLLQTGTEIKNENVIVVLSFIVFSIYLINLKIIDSLIKVKK